MNWTTGSLLAALVLYAILAFVCRLVYRDSYLNRTRNTVIAAILGVILINGVTLAATDDVSKPGVSHADMAQAFGLQSGHGYLASTMGIAYGNDGFTLRGFADTKDGRVLNVDFTHQGVTYPLSLPADRVVIDQVPASVPQLTIWLSNKTADRYGTKQVMGDTSCGVRFAGILTCDHHVTYRTNLRGDVLLSQVIHDGTAHVVLRLSPTMFMLLGNPSGA